MEMPAAISEPASDQQTERPESPKARSVISCVERTAAKFGFIVTGHVSLKFVSPMASSIQFRVLLWESAQGELSSTIMELVGSLVYSSFNKVEIPVKRHPWVTSKKTEHCCKDAFPDRAADQLESASVLAI